MWLLFLTQTPSVPLSHVPCLPSLLFLHEITWYFMLVELTLESQSFVMSQHNLPIYSPIYLPPYLPSYMPTCDTIYQTCYRYPSSPFVFIGREHLNFFVPLASLVSICTGRLRSQVFGFGLLLEVRPKTHRRICSWNLSKHRRRQVVYAFMPRVISVPWRRT